MGDMQSWLVELAPEVAGLLRDLFEGSGGDPVKARKMMVERRGQYRDFESEIDRKLRKLADDNKS